MAIPTLPILGPDQTWWVDRSGDPGLVFTSQANGSITAELFQQRQNTFQTTGVMIPERCIEIEERNLNEVMRGIPQKIWKLSQLQQPQKAAIMGSLQNRSIEIMRDLGNTGSIVIHALP